MSDYSNSPKFEKFDASDYKVGIVVAKFNSQFTSPMLEEAQKLLGEYGVKGQNVKIIEVAGCMEAPLALQALAEKRMDCLVAIGVIIKGETAHFDYVAKTISDGILKVSLDKKIPIGFAVLTAFNEDQVKARIHHGRDAAVAALHSAKELKAL